MPSPSYAREIAQRYRMQAGRCASCADVAFPPKKICPRCRGERIDPVALPDEGTLVTWTVIHSAPEKLAVQTPYVVAIVDMGNGIKVTAQIVDCDPAELSAGCKLRRMLRRISAEGKAGIIHYGYKFVPA
jgi:uncharacterized OB-fold protein